MNYPKEFEKYWNNSQAKRDTRNNPSDKHYAYLAWKAGRRFGHMERGGVTFRTYGLQMGD